MREQKLQEQKIEDNQKKETENMIVKIFYAYRKSIETGNGYYFNVYENEKKKLANQIVL